MTNGATRVAKSWKGIIIIWFLSLLLAAAIALPLKGSLNAGIGNSLITERLSEGIDIEVFTDLGLGLKSLISSFTSGFLVLLVLGFLLNTFLNGGLFSSLRGAPRKFSSSKFFSASAGNFWSFFVIAFIITCLLIFQFIIIILIPVSIVATSESVTETSVYNSFIITGSLSAIAIIILLLVADFARAWQVAAVQSQCFKAIGFGFRETFKTFLSSFPLMLFFITIQLLFVWFVFRILSVWIPETSWGVFILFIVSQVFFIFKISLRTWRYASITSFVQERYMADIILTPEISAPLSTFPDAHF
jgi:hypothetical protein